MSEPARMPQTRDAMIRAVCEANGGNQASGACVCIREGILPCMAQAGFADDVLRWMEASGRMQTALALCAVQFRSYERLHLAKPDHEKAKRNAVFAEMCESVLREVSR